MITNEELSITSSTKTDKEKLTINVGRQLSFYLKKCKPITIKWQSSKVEEIFAYLLHHVGRTIEKAKLADFMWPKLSHDKAYKRLYKAIYHMRQNLKTLREFLLIKNVQSGYQLLIRNTTINMEQWEKELQKAPPLQIDTIQTYEDIMALYGGNYLEHHHYAWARKEQIRLTTLWANVANQIADCYLSNGYVDRAALWYDKVWQNKIDDTHSHFSLMKIYDALGYGLLVDHQYVRYINGIHYMQGQANIAIKEWYEIWKNIR